ncbi:MAG: sugar phosphate nucleotidyltransferase [Bacteroidia bacterium]|nr:sugar phosphate nucleotidyltransferase [Bacteroidia bacterium]MDW8134668.1 sugar phosphate nucleotidyltransferase [Bacteroidia bacterium]
MKVVVPVAGAGLHLRPHTYTHPKPLIPIAGKPLISHIVEELISAGFTDFIFILGYLSEKVRHFLLTTYGDRISLSFVHQEPRLGLAHAVSLTQAYFQAQEPMLIMVGDTLLRLNWDEVHNSTQSRVGISIVENPSDFGIVEIDETGRLLRLTEKPLIPRSNYALVGLYLIRETAALFEAIQYLLDHHITSHGEYHLTDALQKLVEWDIPIYTLPVQYWLDCERKEALLEANKILLGNLPPLPLPEYPHSVIIPPVYIPNSCKLYRSIIGPYVSLGEGVEIQNSVVQDSLIGSYSRVHNMLLRGSVIGGDALLMGRESSLNLGENTVIEL